MLWLAGGGAALAAESTTAQPAGGRAPTVDVAGQARKPRPGSPTPGQASPPAGVPAAPATSSGPGAAPAAPATSAGAGVPASPVSVAPSAPSVETPASTGGYISVPAPQGVPSGEGQAAGFGPGGAGASTARAPHVLASEDVERPLRELRAQMHDEPVGARVDALLGGGTGTVAGEAEWRAIEAGGEAGEAGAAHGAWSTLSPGMSAQGVLEVRTGLFGGARLTLQDGGVLELHRLTRATIRTVRVGDDAPGDPAARRIVVNMARGKIVAIPAANSTSGGGRITIVTPDWIVAASEPTEVTHDAQRRTTYRVVAR